LGAAPRLWWTDGQVGRRGRLRSGRDAEAVRPGRGLPLMTFTIGLRRPEMEHGGQDHQKIMNWTTLAFNFFFSVRGTRVVECGDTADSRNHLVCPTTPFVLAVLRSVMCARSLRRSDCSPREPTNFRRNRWSSGDKAPAEYHGLSDRGQPFKPGGPRARALFVTPFCDGAPTRSPGTISSPVRPRTIFFHITTSEKTVLKVHCTKLARNTWQVCLILIGVLGVSSVSSVLWPCRARHCWYGCPVVRYYLVVSWSRYYVAGVGTQRRSARY